MTIPQITILDEKTYHLKQVANLRQFFIEFSDIPRPSGVYSGIDPGTKHLGLAFINTGRKGFAWEVEIERQDSTCLRLIHLWELLERTLPPPRFLTIEGASYADCYRQIELQDIRAGAVAWMLHNFDYEPNRIKIVPPLTIRKVVFGSAKIKNPWTEQSIPDNAAAALACALFSIMKEEEDE